MKNYLALLRAVNVGKRTVKMEELKKILHQAGFQAVQTYIQSGNVLLQSAEPDPHSLRVKLEQLISNKFGFWVDVILRDIVEMQQIVHSAPFTIDEQAEWKQYVCLLNQPPAQNVSEIIDTWNGPHEQYRLNGRELYVKLHKSLTGAPVKYNHLEKVAKQPSTTRNWNVIQHLYALLQGKAISGA